MGWGRGASYAKAGEHSEDGMVPRPPKSLGKPDLIPPWQDIDTVRHHVILGEALSVEVLRKGGHRNSLLGSAHWLVFYNHSGQV